MGFRPQAARLGRRKDDRHSLAAFSGGAVVFSVKLPDRQVLPRTREMSQTISERRTQLNELIICASVQVRDDPRAKRLLYETQTAHYRNKTM